MSWVVLLLSGAVRTSEDWARLLIVYSPKVRGKGNNNVAYEQKKRKNEFSYALTQAEEMLNRYPPHKLSQPTT